MIKLLLTGDLVCNAVGRNVEIQNKQVLGLNTMVWSAVGIGVAL